MSIQFDGKKELKTGKELFSDLDEYLCLLETEFRHEKLSPRLQELALNGLKISTGKDFTDWHLMVKKWIIAIDEILQTEDLINFQDFQQVIINHKSIFEKFMSFINQAPLEAEKFLRTHEAKDDVENIFNQKGVKLLSTIINWIEHLKNINNLKENILTPAAKEGGIEPTIGFASLNNINSAVESALAVELTNISKSYGSLKAVKNISLSIYKGEIFGLLGPNGAGKSSLIECVLRIRKPDQGAINLLGEPVEKQWHNIKKQIGVQLQIVGFYPLLTAKETLELYASFYQRALSPIELLEMVGLKAQANTKTKDLSGGMRQSLSLAVALINNPDLIFLDEPTTGLDPKARRNLWNIILELKKHGKTVLMSTHYMEEAEYLCDRIAIMDNGEVIELGAPSDLIKKHIGQKTIEVDYQGQINLNEAGKMPGVSRAWVREEKAIIISEDERKTVSELLNVGFPGAHIKNILIRRGNLEDVFLKLTNRGLQL